MNSNYNELRALLEKYYEGATTEQEERLLRNLLRASELPSEFDTDRKLFDSLDATIEAPAWLKKSIERKIDNSPAPILKAPRWTFAVKIAATILLIAAVGIPLLRPGKAGRQELSPEEVREITAMALYKFSSTMEKGYEAIETAENTTFETTDKALNIINSL